MKLLKNNFLNHSKSDLNKTINYQMMNIQGNQLKVRKIKLNRSQIQTNEKKKFKKIKNLKKSFEVKKNKSCRSKLSLKSN